MNQWINRVLVLLLLAPVVAAAADRGLEVSMEADRRDTGWGSSEVSVLMTLLDRQGRKSERYMRVRSREMDGDGDRGLVIFDQPRDVEGTAVLTWSHSLESDDQWIFLPALKRVKRIAANNKSRPFMGSEFAYEDLASQEVDKYRHTLLRTEPCGQLQCFVVEREPRYEHSGYSRQHVWIDTEHYRTQKVAYFDLQGQPFKTLELSGYQQYQDKFWRADRLTMENLKNGKVTVMERSGYRFGLGLTARDFDQATLKRVR